MDLYKSWFLDGRPDGSGTKTKPYKHVSQIACMCVSFFLVLNVHIPLYLGSRRKPFFRTSKFFLFSSSCFNYINRCKFYESPNFYFLSLLNLCSVSLSLINPMWYGITLTLFSKFRYLDEKMFRYLDEKMYLARWLFPLPTFFLWCLLIIIFLSWIKLTSNHFHLSHSYMSIDFKEQGCMNSYNQSQLFVYTNSHIRIVKSPLTIQVTTYQLISSLLTIGVGPRHTNLFNLW
jgi:hypothetical protein